MSDQQKDMSGVLFRNTEKDANHPKWPDYQGNLTIGGKAYWLSGWANQSKGGKKYLALTVKPKDEAKSEPKHAEDSGADDNMPF